MRSLSILILIFLITTSCLAIDGKEGEWVQLDFTFGDSCQFKGEIGVSESRWGSHRSELINVEVVYNYYTDNMGMSLRPLWGGLKDSFGRIYSGIPLSNKISDCTPGDQVLVKTTRFLDIPRDQVNVLVWGIMTDDATDLLFEIKLLPPARLFVR